MRYDDITRVLTRERVGLGCPKRLRVSANIMPMPPAMAMMEDPP